MVHWVDRLFLYVGIPSMVIYTGLSAYLIFSNPKPDLKRREAVIRQAEKYREMRRQQDAERIDKRSVSSEL